MPAPPRLRRLWDAYRFPGFRPSPTVIGIFGDPLARIITLTRRSKKPRAAPAVGSSAAGTIVGADAFAISGAAICASTSTSKSGAWLVARAAR